MTRKHFRALAEALRSTSAVYLTCAAVADVCSTQNDNFDREKFMEACGHGEGGAK